MTRLASLTVRSVSRSSRCRSCIPFRRVLSFSAFEPASAARKSLSADWRNVEFIMIPSLVSKSYGNKSPNCRSIISAGVPVTALSACCALTSSVERLRIPTRFMPSSALGLSTETWKRGSCSPEAAFARRPSFTCSQQSLFVHDSRMHLFARGFATHTQDTDWKTSCPPSVWGKAANKENDAHGNG